MTRTKNLQQKCLLRRQRDIPVQYVLEKGSPLKARIKPNSENCQVYKFSGPK